MKIPKEKSAEVKDRIKIHPGLIDQGTQYFCIFILKINNLQKRISSLMTWAKHRKTLNR